ncbi:MAG TPA: hypothetical protein VMU11_01900 [Verrucomicrobiae bacterium]|nr:hypothetical protein [Verrucomicrobiae bacterium]
MPSLRRPAAPPPAQVGGRQPRDAASAVLAKLRRGGGINLPTANAVAFSAQRQAEGAYQEGLGSQDAFEAGVGPQGETTEPVLRTIPQSYVGEDEAESEFAQEQAEMRRTQEQFLPGSTGLPSASFEQTQERGATIRPTGAEAPGPDLEFQQAAALAAQQAFARQAALTLAEEEEEEGEDEDEESTIARSAESVHRAYVFGADFLGAVEALVFSESVIGALPGLFEVLVSANTRLVIWGFKVKRGSLIRKIEPPAQFPFEVTAIVTADILIAMIFFIAVCILLALCFVVYALATSIPGVPDVLGFHSLVSNVPGASH